MSLYYYICVPIRAAVLSSKPQVLFNYFKQRFAQVRRDFSSFGGLASSRMLLAQASSTRYSHKPVVPCRTFPSQYTAVRPLRTYSSHI